MLKEKRRLATKAHALPLGAPVSPVPAHTALPMYWEPIYTNIAFYGNAGIQCLTAKSMLREFKCNNLIYKEDESELGMKC